MYKDSKLEIDKSHIKFKNFMWVILFSCVVSGLIVTALKDGDILARASTLLGVITGLLVLSLCFPIYLKRYILLSDIENVEIVNIEDFKKKVKAEKVFWGMPKYSFPIGLNEKKSDKVMLIKRRNKRLIVGLVFEKYDEMVEVLRENGIENNHI